MSRPLAPTAAFKPPHAPLAAYREVRRALGLSRAVFVQGTSYGFDNSCMLDAMAELGPEAARGVAIIEPDIDDARIEALHKAGVRSVRGVRYMMLAGGVLPWDTMERMSARIANWGWNINLQLDGRDLPQHLPMLKRLESLLVIDHTGIS